MLLPQSFPQLCLFLSVCSPTGLKPRSLTHLQPVRLTNAMLDSSCCLSHSSYSNRCPRTEVLLRHCDSPGLHSGPGFLTWEVIFTSKRVSVATHPALCWHISLSPPAPPVQACAWKPPPSPESHKASAIVRPESSLEPPWHTVIFPFVHGIDNFLKNKGLSPQ